MVIAAANMIVEHIEAELIATMVTALDVDDPTRISTLRPGKLQDDPTEANGLNILIYASNEEQKIALHTDNVQNGLTSPTFEIGGGAFFIHPYSLRFTLHFKGERDRSIARTNAQIVLARARNTIMSIGMPTHPDTGQPKDDFGESIIEVQVTKAFINEGGGPGHFIWRGWLYFEFLTEQQTRHYALYD